MERQFRSGRIGGTRTSETTHHTAIEVSNQVFRDERGGAEVLVYVVLRMNSPRVAVHNAHGQVWTIQNRHIHMNQVDEILKTF
jgi:hypothetical protein